MYVSVSLCAQVYECVALCRAMPSTMCVRRRRPRTEVNCVKGNAMWLCTVRYASVQSTRNKGADVQLRATKITRFSSIAYETTDDSSIATLRAPNRTSFGVRNRIRALLHIRLLLLSRLQLGRGFPCVLYNNTYNIGDHDRIVHYRDTKCASDSVGCPLLPALLESGLIWPKSKAFILCLLMRLLNYLSFYCHLLCVFYASPDCELDSDMCTFSIVEMRTES